MIATFETSQGITQALYRHLQVGRDGVFGIVNPDYLQKWGADYNYAYNVSRNTRNGKPYNITSGKAVPATCRFTSDILISADCAFQNWMFDLCSARTGLSLEQRKKDWAALTKGNVYITDFAGSDKNHDCINETNADKEFMKFKPMVTGGTLLKIVGESSKLYFVEAINPYFDYLSYKPETHVWLFHEPTVSARYWVDQEPIGDGHPDKVTAKQEQYNEPFYHFGESVRLPIMGTIPDIRSSTGFVNTVEKYRVRVLGVTESVPNPYIMRYGRTKKNPYGGF